MKAYIIYKHVLNFEDDTYVVGGIETYLLSLARVLIKNEIEPIIVQRGDVDFKVKKDGVTFWGCSVEEKKYFKRLYNKIKDEILEEDLVIWGTDTFSMRIPHKRTLSIQHGIDFDYYPEENNLRKKLLDLNLGWIFKFLQRRRALSVFNRANYKVCVDYNFWNWYRTFSVPKNDKNIYVIPNFANIDVNEKIKEDSGEIKVVFARRFVRRRGVEIFVEVVKELSHLKNVTFTFAGEGPYKKEIEKLQEKNKNVYITKYNPNEAIEFHKQFDIAVIPTIGSEGTSFSLLEAMSAGNAVVCTAVGGMTNIVLDGFNGLMIKPNSVKELKDAIIRLVHSVNLRKELSENSKLTIAKSFSEKIWEERWTKVINEIKKV